MGASIEAMPNEPAISAAGGALNDGGFRELQRRFNCLTNEGQKAVETLIDALAATSRGPARGEARHHG